MTAENQTIEITAGDDFQRTIPVTEGGSAKDLTGATLRWVVARNQGGDPVVTSSDVGVTLQVLAPATDGQVRLTVDNTVTSPLLGDYFHELEVVDSGGNTVTVTRGRFTVEADTA